MAYALLAACGLYVAGIVWLILELHQTPTRDDLEDF
jgi:hypothetical protein